MSVSLDDKQHYEIESLIADTIESLDGADAILATLAEQSASPATHARLHAVRDVLVVCHTRLENAASMLDV